MELTYVPHAANTAGRLRMSIHSPMRIEQRYPGRSIITYFQFGRFCTPERQTPTRDDCSLPLAVDRFRTPTCGPDARHAPLQPPEQAVDEGGLGAKRAPPQPMPSSETHKESPGPDAKHATLQAPSQVSEPPDQGKRFPNGSAERPRNRSVSGGGQFEARGGKQGQTARRSGVSKGANRQTPADRQDTSAEDRGTKGVGPEERVDGTKASTDTSSLTSGGSPHNKQGGNSNQESVPLTRDDQDAGSSFAATEESPIPSQGEGEARPGVASS